jgi:ribonuclease HI/uncharacterized phage-like protein YoqJ
MKVTSATMPRMSTIVYTDGACSGNPGPGGWAWAVPDGPFGSGAEAHTTNQRMEIMAAAEALDALDGPVTVVSDSTYVVNCFNKKWYVGWKAKGWKNSKKQDVANQDLWRPLIEHVLERGDVTWKWVKGHSGDQWNDVVDRLAVEAAMTQQGRSGDRPPDTLGPADLVGGAAKPAASAPAAATPPAPSSAAGKPVGHLVVVLGHRPPELGGYEPNFLHAAVQRRLGDILAAQAQLDEDLVLVTGLQLGTEQLAAEAAIDRGVPFVVVQPFPDPDARWPSESRGAYKRLLSAAREVVLLQKKPVKSNDDVRRAMGQRDAWLTRIADAAIVVWDGRDPMLAKQVKALEKEVGDEVWIIDPAELG